MHSNALLNCICLITVQIKYNLLNKQTNKTKTKKIGRSCLKKMVYVRVCKDACMCVKQRNMSEKAREGGMGSSLYWAHLGR